VQLHWLPTAGRETVGDSSLLDQVRHLVLPALVLSLRYVAVWSRYMRSSMLNVVHADYVRTARGKGLRERQILIRHAMKNALIPVVSVMALDLSGVFSGAVITETIFGWPGLGRLVVQAIDARDYPLVQGTVLVIGVSYVAINTLTDLLHQAIDPRLQDAR
jgi:peptide/nickel transport system permease protein